MKIAFSCTREPLKVIVALAFGREVECELKTKLRPRAKVGRLGLRTIPRLIPLERSGPFLLKSIEVRRVELELGSQSIQGPLDQMSKLGMLLKNSKVSGIKIDGKYLKLFIPEYGFEIAGLPGEAAQGAYEICSNRWYTEADVSGKVVVDIGGFIGDSALFFLNRGARLVYVYEPSKEFWPSLILNVGSSQKVRPFNYGLGCGEREATLGGKLTRKKVEKENEEKVETAAAVERILIRDFNSAMKQIIDEEGRIGLLKIDCEGCESEILGCAERDIFEKIDGIYVEIHGEDHVKLVQKIEQMNFRLEVSKTLTSSLGMYYFSK